jgi:hypothetical protein
MIILSFSAHPGTSANKACRVHQFIRIVLYTSYSIQNETKQHIACCHCLLVQQIFNVPQQIIYIYIYIYS